MLRKMCKREFCFSLGAVAVDNSGTTTTTPSPAFRSCVSNCPSINNYNPVCGSNGVTYDNQYKLECARRCGLRKCFYALLLESESSIFLAANLTVALTKHNVMVHHLVDENVDSKL